MNIKIIYEDQHIIILDKPANMLSHAAKFHSGNDILSELGHSEYATITRLDYQTSGLMLIGKTKSATSALNHLAMTSQIHKTYEAIVLGYFPVPENTMTAYLLKDEKNSVVRLSNNKIPNSLEITTKYHVISEKNGFSHISIDLLTGRTHQIRAHMAYLEHPVAGDPLYGNIHLNKKMKLKTQALVSMQIAFNIPDANNMLHYLDNRIFVKSDFPFRDILEKR